MPKIRLFWSDSNHQQYEECLLIASSKLPKDAEDIIERFNSSLRPNEKARNFVKCEVIDEDLHKHDWEKASLVTERGGYDRMKCLHCGATGKRYGLGSGPEQIDKPFGNYCVDIMPKMAMPKAKR